MKSYINKIEEHLTSKNWWRNALLLPLLIFIFQSVMAINDDFKFLDKHDTMDEYDSMFGFIIATPIVIAFYLLIKRINNNLGAKEINNDLEKEIEDLLLDLSKKNFNNYKHLKVKLESIRS